MRTLGFSGAQFGTTDVEVLAACVDLDEVVSMRQVGLDGCLHNCMPIGSSISWYLWFGSRCAVSSIRDQAAQCLGPAKILVDFNLCHEQPTHITHSIEPL